MRYGTRSLAFFFYSWKGIVRLGGAKQRSDKTQLFPRVRAWLRPGSWVNTMLVALLWPFLLLCVVYLAVFFVLNSSYAPKILHAQLSSLLKGDYVVESIRTDPYLRRLYLRNVRLSEAGASDYAIFAGEVEAKIPLFELFDLITMSTLTLGRIEAKNADVILDFRNGELNLLKIVLPYTSSPSSEPSDFVINLSDLNVTNARVNLLFDGFTLFFDKVRVRSFALRAGSVLEMYSAIKVPEGKSNIYVGEGYVEFNPASFSFPLSYFGDPSEGLVFSAASGATATVGQSLMLSSVALQEIVRQGREAWYSAPILLQALRGNFKAPIAQVNVQSFRWFDNAFEVSDVSGQVSGGRFTLPKGWMNVGPKSEVEVLVASKEHGFVGSGFPPQRSVLWAAELDLGMPLEDPVLKYFFGSLLQGSESLQLHARLGGDLNRVDGDLSLELPSMEVEGIAFNRASLQAKMAGQALQIERFEAESELGPLFVSGLYKIMDGDFDIQLYSGITPEHELAEGFGSLLSEGLAPLEILPDGVIKKFAGRLFTQLHITQSDGLLSLTAPKAISWRFDTPIAGMSSLSLAPYKGGDEQSLITLKHNILRSPGGIRVALGSDKVELQPGFMLNLNDMRCINARGSAHFADLKPYASTFLGMDELHTGGVDLDFNIESTPKSMKGDIQLKASDIQFQNYVINTVDVDLEIHDGELRSKRFDVQSDFAALDLSLSSKFPRSRNGEIEMDVMAMPLDATIRLKSLDFEKIPHSLVPVLGLKGQAGAEIRVQGTIPELKVGLDYEMRDVEIFGEKIPLAQIGANYSKNSVELTHFALWLTEPKEGKEAQLEIKSLNYAIKENVVTFSTKLRPVPISQFAVIRDLGLALKATASFELEGQVDLDALSTVESALSSSYLRGELKLSEAEYDSLKFGTSTIMFSHANVFTLIKGTLADRLSLSGYVRATPKLAASVSLNFPDLDLLSTMREINLDVGELLTRFQLSSAKVAGSLGFCYTGPQSISLTLIMDKLDVDVLRESLHLGQTARLNVDLVKRSLDLRSLELIYGESVLKASGSADMAGNMDVDLNGEVDADVVRTLTDVVRDSSGLFSLSLSAKGNYLHRGRLSVKNLEVSGFVGVRNPIRVLTSYAEAPIVLERGFVMLGNKNPCPRGVNCIYTPEGQSFKLGVQDQWLELSFLADQNGAVQADLSGILHAALSQLFSKEISAARGSLATKISAKGSLLDKNGDFKVEAQNFSLAGEVKVQDPIIITMRSLNEPIELASGRIMIADSSVCEYGLDCFSIPKTESLRGRLLGGTYVIFGEIWREAFLPRGGTISMTANNIGYRVQDELSLTLSPDIQIFIDDVAYFETYVVSGDIEVMDARYQKNFDAGGSNVIRDQILSMFIESKRRVDTYSPSFLRKMPQVGKINLNLNIRSENSIRVDVQIAGASLDLELGSQINVGGNIKDIQPTGLLSISSGEFSMRENDFEFQNGAQVAFNGSLDGSIDIVAQAEINTSATAFSSVLGSSDLDRRKRIQSSDRGNSELYIVTLNVGGSVFAPQWSFESSPYLTNANIYALVLTGKTIDEFSGNDVAMETLLSPLFSSQLDSLLNADQFKFVFSEGAAQFIYVKQINKGLRIAAGVSIRGAQGNEQAISAEYYFNDNWSVDLTGQNTADEAGKAPTFKLGARLRWHLPLDY